MWRYAPILPVTKGESVVSLGEGDTPLLPVHRIGGRIGAADLLVKDEGLNPTGSFKARGLSCAVSMCVELGIKKVAIPSAGNAASALAAYAAAAGIEAHIFMPRDVPHGEFHRVQSLRRARHAGRRADQRLRHAWWRSASRTEGWFDISTLKEPYRIEGKKTMGYEVAEQMDWELPDAIFYPTGGGVGMIGMWKAFDEMEALGWIGAEAPQDDRGAGGRLPADRARVSGRRSRIAIRADHRGHHARARRDRELHRDPDGARIGARDRGRGRRHRSRDGRRCGDHRLRRQAQARRVPPAPQPRARRGRRCDRDRGRPVRAGPRQADGARRRRARRRRVPGRPRHHARAGTRDLEAIKAVRRKRAPGGEA